MNSFEKGLSAVSGEPLFVLNVLSHSWGSARFGMMSIYDLKPKFQNLLRPLVRVLASIGVSPNQVTIAALVLSFIVGLVVICSGAAPWSLFLIPGALFVRMALNAVDGMLAMEHDGVTPVGGILNELGDVISDAVLYLPFAVVSGVHPTGPLAVVFLAGLTEMAGVVAVQVGASRRYDGPMGKSDRAFAMSVLAVLLGFGIQPGIWSRVFFGVMIALLLITVWNRVYRASAEVRS